MNSLNCFVIITTLVIIMIYICSLNLPIVKKKYVMEFINTLNVREEPRNDSIFDLNFVIEPLLTNSLDSLKTIFNCENRLHLSQIAQRGEFWVLHNWVKGQHGELQCHDSITLTTHGDYTFLQNLRYLTERWNGPVSVALHAPGFDLLTTLLTIKQARYCLPLVKKWVSFHVFFHQEHLPPEIPQLNETLETYYTTNCTDFEIAEYNHNDTYTTQHELEYPVNVARNAARDSALTHLVLAVDIELYPSPGMAQAVLQMIARDPTILHRDNPFVFTLPEFEINIDKQPPADKNELLTMINNSEAFLMHVLLCSFCHRIPLHNEWCAQSQTPEMEILGVGKRAYNFTHWEPIHIGVRDELPSFDERLTWQAKRNKMTQAYILCLQDYDFLVLNNAFVTHRPGVKLSDNGTSTPRLKNTTRYLYGVADREYDVIYGARLGCDI